MLPDDWPFDNLKLGEYISFARQAARIDREHKIEFATAVEEVLGDRTVSDVERSMLIQR